jgi:hypothetical protein
MNGTALRAVCFFAALAVAMPAAAQSKYQVPRTPWGDPDLTGKWPANDMQGTPYERPAELGQRNVLSEQEFAQRQGASDRQAALDAEQVVVQRPRANAGTGPPSHWGERGTPSRQASLIVDPPDGRLPPMTEEGKKRIALARSTYWYDFPDAVVKHPFETFTDLGPYDRCITRGVLASMLPTGYNMGTEIFQFPGHVVIQNEMIHEVRVIPTDGRPHVSDRIRQWMGDSRGRWEGDTLVVETTNFNGRSMLATSAASGRLRGVAQSANSKIVERFTPLDKDTIKYEVTIEDAGAFSKPVTIMMPLNRDEKYLIVEYGCHEGNYAIPNELTAGRTADKAAAGAK